MSMIVRAARVACVLSLAVPVARPCLADYPPQYRGGIGPTAAVFDPDQPRAVVFGAGGGFVVDVSDPAAPRMMYYESNLGSPPYTLWDVAGQRGVAFRDGRLLVSPIQSGLTSDRPLATLFDLTDPLEYWRARKAPLGSPSEPRAVALVGDIAAVTYASEGAVGPLLNLHDQSVSPWQEVGSVEVTGCSTAVEIGQRLAVGGAGGVDLVDLNDPTAPAVVGHLDEAVEDLALDGTLLVARQQADGSTSRLLTIDVSDPTEPLVVGVLEGLADVGSLACDQGHAYLGRVIEDGGAWHGDTVVVSLADPAAPAVEGLLATGPTHGVAVRDGVLVTAAGAQGARVARLAGPTQLAAPPIRLRGRRYVGVAGTKGRIYIAGAGEGVWILGKSAAESPAELGLWQRDSLVGGGTLAGSRDTLCVVDDGQLVVVEVSDPISPVTLAELPAPADPIVGMEADGGVVAFTTSLDDGIHLVDARDPATAAYAGIVPAEQSSSLRALALEGTVLAWAFTDQELHLADVSDPWAPVETRSYTPAQLYPAFAGLHILDLAVDSGRLWIDLGRSSQWDPFRGLLVDVRDPWAPAVLGEYESLGALIEPVGNLFVTVASPVGPPGPGPTRM